MKSEKGFSLVESLVSLAIISLLAVGFLGGLSNSSRAAVQIGQMDTARALAQSQMEYVKELAFKASGDYSPNPAITSQYPGYSVSIAHADPAATRDALIQNIRITVSCGDQDITTLEDFKTRR